MRLRTLVTNPPLLIKLAQSFEKLAKSCILRFTPSNLRFIVKADAEGGVQVWSIEAINPCILDTLTQLLERLHVASVILMLHWAAKLAHIVLNQHPLLECEGFIMTHPCAIQEHVFNEYTVESIYENEINLEVVLDHFLRALRSSHNALSVAMKLTKKENIPLLSIIISNQSRTGKVMALNQDIPVRVLGPRQMEHIHEPLVPEPQVNILMPSLMSIRSIAERMKAISNTIEVSANTNGELRLKVESELVQIVTYYKNLLNPELDITSQVGTPRETATARDAHDFVSAKVDIRNFIKFLHSYHVAPNNVVCCIIENFAVVIHVYVNSSLTTFFGQQNCAALTYYIPVRAQ